MSKQTNRIVSAVRGAVGFLFPRKFAEIPPWVWRTAKDALPATITMVDILRKADGLTGIGKLQAVTSAVRDMLDEALDEIPGLSSLTEKRRDSIIESVINIIYQIGCEVEGAMVPILDTGAIEAIEHDIIANDGSSVLLSTAQGVAGRPVVPVNKQGRTCMAEIDYAAYALGARTLERGRLVLRIPSNNVAIKQYTDGSSIRWAGTGWEWSDKS